MANIEHVAKLRQGVAAWNEWRQANPDLVTDLTMADLRGANLSKAVLKAADLSLADLSRTELYMALLSQAELIMAVLGGANLSGADLSWANLSRAYLRKAVLSRTRLNKAVLSRTRLDEANLALADLRGADLRRARLNEADLTMADLRGADLSEAVLHKTVFRGARLDRADLSRATLSEVTFADVDLSQTVGLETIQHLGPSSIGTDTLIRSQGRIPELFLRGCGIPDSWIEYLPSLIGALQPIQYYSCFISYSSRDEDFAKRLHSRMQQEHLRVWYAPEDLKGGEKLYEQLERAIQLHDRLLLVLSEHSIASDWVHTELRRARRQEEKEQRRKLFPIRLCSYEAIQDWQCIEDTGRDLAAEVLSYVIPDFSTWKDHDTFEAAFARLLVDLRAEEGKIKKP